MTVEPNRAPDGNGQPKAAENGVETGDPLGSSALPPTLFTLPNLNPGARKPQPAAGVPEPAETIAAQEAPAPQSESDSGSAPTPQIAEPPSDTIPTAPQAPVPAPTSEVASTSTDDDSRAPTPPVIPSETITPASAMIAPLNGGHPAARNEPESVLPRTQPPRNSSSMPDLPAGRSWMETIGSHGVVVVLLLVVVAAALVTGRGSGDSESETLAENSDLLNFDVGTEVDLPIPAHGIDAHFAEANDSDVSSVQLPEEAGSEPAFAATESPAAAAAQEQTLSESSSEAVSEPIVKLDSPQPTPPQAGPTEPVVDPQDAMEAFAFDSNGVKFNEFVSGGGEAEFVPASNRQGDTNNSFKLPTLEDLDDQPTADATAVAAVTTTKPDQAVAQQTSGRVRSKTPVGITDFLPKYFPTLESPVTAGAEATPPSN